MGIAESWRRARWLRVVVAGGRRHGPVLRVTAAVLAALGLGGVAFAGIGSPVGAQQGEAGDQAETDRRAATSIIFTEPRFAPGVAPHIRVGERFKIEIHDVPQGVTAHIYLTGPIQPEGRCRARGATGAAAPRRVGPGPSTGSGYYDGMKIDGCAVGTGNIRVVNADESERYATASIAVRAGTTSPTPTPMPTPTPRPTAAPPPQPPPDTGVPSFGTVAAVDHRFRVGHAVSVPLPAATGGNGTLSYGLAPALRSGLAYDLGNGLAFDAGTRAISGTPTAAADRTTYTYTATDADGDSVQISVHVTVFDIAETVVEGGIGRSLQDATWGVLDYRAVVLQEGTISRTDGYQLRLRIPASTGFQFGRTCTWPAAAPTDSTMLESHWVQSNHGFYVVRCALGSGAAVRVEVQARLGDSGTPSVLYHTTMEIKQSWHRNDHRVTYYIRGTSGASINGVTAGSQEGLFPASTNSPNAALTKPAHYANAANAWAGAGARDVALSRVTSAAGADVIIEGYWNPGTDDDQCGGSVACTYAAGTYPHTGNGQRFAIEDPPQWRGGKEEEWTTDLKDATEKRMEFEYLPWVLMHEFGHTLGLGHSADSDAIMGGNSRRDLSDTDAQGLRATYAHHAKH